MKPALVIQHGDLGPPGILAEWLRERDIRMVVHRADGDDPWPPVAEHAFVACLGSRFSPTDADEPAVAMTRRHLEHALAADVPVLGLCFGGQLLADVLGGRIGAVPDGPELGWKTIESAAPELVPEGPWLQWHWHCFTTPPDAEELARSETGTQAFRHGAHLGVQFHPESTIEIVAGWANHDRDRLREHGILDGPALLDEGRAHAETAARNARRLFDGFLAGTRNGKRGS